MPCPYFEPRQLVAQPLHPNARLPMIEEYEGQCRATDEPMVVSGETRWHCCNHGNARGQCPSFPRNETRSALRFDVVRRSAVVLDLLVIEESAYTPVAWRRLSYRVADQQITPAQSDLCLAAQIRAFCGSYLRRFPDAEVSSMK